MSEDDIVSGIQAPGRFDADASSEDDARRLIQKALPHAVEAPRAIAGEAYPSAPPGAKAWYQIHPPEPAVGLKRPHLKYSDWTRGKKGRGGTWGHIFFPPDNASEVRHVGHV